MRIDRTEVEHRQHDQRRREDDPRHPLPQRAEQYTEQMPGVGIHWLPLQHLRITRLRVLEPALLVPGHTPADMAYAVDGKVFVGDTLFMPDVGTARADFPGGSAATLYQSIQRLLALPPQTEMYVCHDYPPDSREARWQTTVAIGLHPVGQIHYPQHFFQRSLPRQHQTNCRLGQRLEALVAGAAAQFGQ